MTSLRFVISTLVLLAATSAGLAPAPPAPDAQAPAGEEFVALDVVLEAPAGGLGSYQLEVVAPKGARLVGLEGGGVPEFADAPFYDRAALQGNRVIIAAIGEPQVTTAAVRASPGSEGTGAAPSDPGSKSAIPAAAAPAAKSVRVARLHFVFSSKTDQGPTAKMMAAGDERADRLSPLPAVELKRVRAPGE